LVSVLSVPLVSNGAVLVDSIFWCLISFQFRCSSFPHEFISLAACNGAVRREKVHLVSLPADLKFLCSDSVLPVSLLVYSLCVVSASGSGFAPVSVLKLQSCRRCLLCLFPGGAVQHELLRSSGRCAPHRRSGAKALLRPRDFVSPSDLFSQVKFLLFLP
jgi:hypothetical protein